MLGLGLIARTTAEIRRDIAAVHDRDPAARGVRSLEILASWPGVHALLAHRVAHALHEAGVPFVPRAIATLARSFTGVEIHPAALIGKGFFIDHGMGVVIGETAQIGDDVTLYQGVTLGGTGFVTGKRHPTVQDNVTIGSGAKLLGPITIGAHASIGANAVVVSKSGLTRLIDRMEAAGLVQRLACPGDRRSLHIALADAGEEKYRQALPIHLDHVKRHFAAYIEDGEAAAVESALERIAAACAVAYRALALLLPAIRAGRTTRRHACCSC